MQSGTPQTARETIVAHFRRHYLGGAGTQYFDLLIAGYDAELESLERSVASMKAELARLATQKAENLPDGSREFVWHWPYKIQLNPPRLFLRDGDGWSRCDASDRNAAPPLEVLAEQFAALGREQGFAQKIDALESATRERIATLEDERDQARKHHGHEYQNRIELQGRIAELEAQLAAKDRVAAFRRIDELEQQERDSRAEVADLSRRLEAQKARAEASDRAANGLAERIPALVGESVQWRKRFEAEKARADVQDRRAIDYSGAYAKAVEGLQGSAGTIKALRERLAVLEGELIAAKTVAAGRARTEGAPLAMCATFDPSIAGTYEPHARLYIQRGDSVFSLREGLDREGLEWIKLPPLPSIEPEQSIEANRPEPQFFAVDVPASVFTEDLRERLRAAAVTYGVRIATREKDRCERCGFWEATEAGPVGGLCAKCDHDMDAERVP